MQLTASRHFLSWLYESSASVAFTTYQTNRLFFIGLKPDGSLSTFERRFDRPMGLHAAGDRLLMTARWQLWEFANALPAGDDYRGYDRLYVPRVGHTIGEVDAHDVARDGDGEILFVNTLYSCLAKLSDDHSFRPVWKPPFISRLAPEDRCHLNGLAMADGRPAYVTAISRSDTVSGWRDRRHAGGCVIDVEDDEMVLDTLSMPHAPRVYRDKLWVLNSGTGEIGYVDRRAGRFEPVAFCPGYIRGLAFHGDYAIVGLSKQRKEKAFSGLALDDRLRDKDSDARCGVWVIDLRTGNVVHWLQLEGVVIELYDVVVLPGTRRPMALGFQSDEIRRVLTIDGGARPTLHALESSALESSALESSAPSSSAVPHGAATHGPVAPRPPGASGEAEYRLGNQLARAGHFADAIARYEEALRADPGHVNARINLGTAVYRLGDAAAAEGHYRDAFRVDPKSVRALNNLALLLRERGDIDEAMACYAEARRLEPGNAETLHQLAALSLSAGRWQAARRCLEELQELEPGAPSVQSQLGALLIMERRYDEAIALLERAAAADPQLREAHYNLGLCHEWRCDVEAARASYGRALQVRDDPLLSLHRELLCPAVADSGEQIAEIRARAERLIRLYGKRGLRVERATLAESGCEVPFHWAYYGGDDIELRRAYASLFEPALPLDALPKRRHDGPPRVGFLVTQSNEGVFLRCMGGLIDGLDRERVTPVVASSRPGLDRIRKSLTGEVELVDTTRRFDYAIDRLRAASLDALYFWEVGTDALNYFLAFQRLAPLQCTGWGWPVSSGAPEIDYHITSAALAPDGADAHFCEALARLPRLPGYYERPPVQARAKAPEHYGLPSGARFYLCPQNLRKAHPDFDAVLGDLLAADPKAVVAFVHYKAPRAGDALLARWRRTLPEFTDRLFVLPRCAAEDYPDLLASADVLLDTPYFGGANTAYDAFAFGAPVVTRPGTAPRTRYTAALLAEAGIDECVVDSDDAYVSTAVRIAGDGDLAASIRARMRDACDRLFENRAAITQLEDFFEQRVLR